VSDKPREFWIDWSDGENGDRVYEFMSAAPVYAIHVIEYSAYQKLETELAHYKNQSPEDFLTPYENELLGDASKLREELERVKAERDDKQKMLTFWHDEAHHHEAKASQLEAKLKAIEGEWRTRWNKSEERTSELLTDVVELEAKLARATEALDLATKRSSYQWSEGGAYTPQDFKNEGAIELASQALADIKGGGNE